MSAIGTALQVRPVTSADAPELAELLNAIIVRGGTTALEQSFTPELLDGTYLTGPKVLSCVVAVDGVEVGRRRRKQHQGNHSAAPSSM